MGNSNGTQDYIFIDGCDPVDDKLSAMLIDHYVDCLTTYIPKVIKYATDNYRNTVPVGIRISEDVREKCNALGISGINMINLIYKVTHSTQFADKIQYWAENQQNITIKMPKKLEDFGWMFKYEFRSDMSTSAEFGHTMMYKVASKYFHKHFNKIEIEITNPKPIVVFGERV